MTWKELKAHIEVMDEEQANSDVTVLDYRDEFNKVTSLEFIDPKDCDVLDPNHPFLTTW